MGKALLPTFNAIYRIEDDTLYIAFESMDTLFGIEIGMGTVESDNEDEQGDDEEDEEKGDVAPRPPGFEGPAIFETLYRVADENPDENEE